MLGANRLTFEGVELISGQPEMFFGNLIDGEDIFPFSMLCNIFPIVLKLFFFLTPMYSIVQK